MVLLSNEIEFHLSSVIEKSIYQKSALDNFWRTKKKTENRQMNSGKQFLLQLRYCPGIWCTFALWVYLYTRRGNLLSS